MGPRFEDATMTLTCQGCHKLVTVPIESLRDLPGPPFHYDLAASDAGPLCYGVCLPLSIGARIVP